MSNSLDEILDATLEVYGVPNYYPNDIKVKAKQALLQWVADEVVGDGSKDSVHNMDAHEAKEIHRIEQRQILKDHGWKEELSS